MIIELKVAVLKSKKSQMQIAKETGINPSALSRILNGWSMPDTETTVNLANSLGISTCIIFNAFKKSNRMLKIERTS